MYYSHEEKHCIKILILLITYSQITYPVNENGITVSIFQINRLYTTRQNLEQDEGKEEYMKSTSQAISRHYENAILFEKNPVKIQRKRHTKDTRLITL